MFEADTPAGQAFDIVLLLLITVSVLLTILETVHTLRKEHSELFLIAERTFAVTFACEIVLRLLVARPSCLTYIFSFFGVIDLLAVVPTVVEELFTPGTSSLRLVRVLRLLRVFRVLQFTGLNREADELLAAFWSSRRKIFVFLLAIALIVVVMGTTVYILEDNTRSGFTSIPRSIYWAIVTITTVGYGDVSPITVFGKSIAAITAIFGVVVVALLTGIVANAFNKQMERRKIIFEDQVRDALLDGVLDSDEEASLDALRKKFGMSKSQADALIEHVKKLRDERK